MRRVTVRTLSTTVSRKRNLMIQSKTKIKTTKSAISTLPGNNKSIQNSTTCCRQRRFSSLVPQNKDEQLSSSEVATSDSSSSLIPIDFDTSSSIEGEESQILQVKLKPNQKLRAESGAMIFMTQGVEMSTSLGSSNRPSGTSTSSISDGFKRMLTGQNMFISDYQYNGEYGTTGTLALGTDFPSKIMRLCLKDFGNKIICQKGAYLASDLNVDIEMEFAKKFTAGFFGGEGFILQGLVGDGDVFVKAGGTLVKKELQPGERLRISSGSLVAFTQEVEFDVQTMPGFKNVLFGGEGLFITTLSGPGTVWLQGLPPDRMISEIARRIPSGGIGLGIPIGLGGGGGSESDDISRQDGDEGEVEPSGNSEELVASTDAAIEADRNATVAASGLEYDSSSGIDSESSSALFGDASLGGDTAESSSAATSTVEDDFTSERFTSSNSDEESLPPMDDDTTSFSSSFSTEDVDFGEKLTNKESFDDFQDNSTSFSTEMGEGEDTSGDDAGGGLMNTLWDIFFNDDL